MATSWIGKVVSNKMQKSVLVAVERLTQHPRLKIYYRSVKKFMAHDANDECNLGDTVKIVSHRPISKRKAFLVTDVLRRQPQFESAPLGVKPAETVPRGSAAT